MKKIKLGTSNLEVSNISLGCMRLGKLEVKEAAEVIHNALELGIDFFDHADIYSGGKSEEIFAEAIGMNPAVREQIFIQTKAGIREGYFDFSKEHILAAVDGSLSRLKTDYVDSLLLHRPDALMDPEEVAEAFTILKDSGKVRHFGVSNQNPMQIELLKKYIKQDLIVNQLQFSIMHSGMIDAGIQVNTKHDNSLNRDGSILDYSRLHDMTIQAWSPFQHGFFGGVFIDNEQFPELNSKLEEIGEKYGVNKSAVAIAWILRHPAKIQPIVGTLNTERLTGIAKANEIDLTRKEWYEIYLAAGNDLP
ncbi:aldo/keto reductase family oxidoreductase [Oceanobacillus sp. 143]|uniref:Aldo/keto reductase n=1 Tax=Oceanobacillus zhaokaii TaxID=2052660 RepID=A0A345PF06_9BACI|nr:aldo/keto reductase [Oceanobacillus zhaokaii]AXI08586.1 aldo/keto reductase [Oceanobacillus zhaokaii]QGS68385.1 aldo/keto reductase family oxidoreductase [Oceanobacillus sp. 143]